MFFNYLIKLSGHSGSSNITKAQALEPVSAAAPPIVAKRSAKNSIIIPPLHICLNIKFKPFLHMIYNCYKAY